MNSKTFLVASLIVAGAIFIATLGGALYSAAVLRERRVDPDDVERWRRQALQSLEDGNHQAAREESLRVLRERPGDPVVRANLGRVYQRLAEEQEDPSLLYRAIAEHKLALGTGARLPDLYYNVACYYALAGDLDAGFRWLVQALEAGFGREELLRTDPHLGALRKDPRFEALLSGGRLPRSDPQARARLVSDRIGPGEPTTLEIVVDQYYPAGERAAALPEPEIQWSPSGSLQEVSRERATESEEAHGWGRRRTTLRIRLKAGTDGLFAVPAATVRLGSATLKTGALVLTVKDEAAAAAENVNGQGS